MILRGALLSLLALGLATPASITAEDKQYMQPLTDYLLSLVVVLVLILVVILICDGASRGRRCCRL